MLNFYIYQPPTFKKNSFFNVDERIANFESLWNFPLVQKQISPVCVHSGKEYLLNLQVSEI